MTINIDVKELLDILAMTPSEQNIMLAGAHGIGKSRILTDYFESKGIPVVTLFLGQMSDPGDLIGLPNKNEKTGKTDFLPPYWFPTDGKPIVLFLDELNRARPEILQSVMDMTLNRKLAGKALPEGSRIISAVNAGQEYQLTDLDPALVSRFNIYTFKPSVSEWLLWAEKAEIAPEVIRFIEDNSTFLDGKLSEDADNLEKTPDRRGWERVSNILKNSPVVNVSLKKSIAGIIGPKVANVFFEEIKKTRKVNGKDVLNDFHKHKENLEQMTLPELSTVNDSLMRHLELNKPKNAKEKSKWVFNGAEYITWLTTEQSNREAAAHFAETFQRAQYPKASAFLLAGAPDIYTKLAEFIMNL
ncbi:MAG: AAA family ATPase [Muribaculaceae bacterium]|nr:AAA family ATPase [Muribaculaceae bacterium]